MAGSSLIRLSSLNAYYAFIHPYLPLLPPPAVPQYEDRPVIIRIQNANFPPPREQVVPHWPVSPLSLALSAILVLIPPPGDISHAHKTALRGEYSEIYASSALESVERDIELLRLTPRTGVSGTNLSQPVRRPLHPNVQLELESILALVTLCTYEYCQRGNISKMRFRANQAVTTAMDMSLHDLGKEAIETSESQRRAWWMTMYMAYFSSVLNVSPPIISADDPRITTPYPQFLVPLEPWPLVLKAQQALFTTAEMLKDLEAGSDGLQILSEGNFDELNTYIQSLVVESDRPLPVVNRQKAESSAAEGIWIIARILIHTARIRLHRLKAFLDAPIFLQKHCGLSSIAGLDSSSTLSRSISRTRDLGTIFPFTEQQSSSLCLTSALVVARSFNNLPPPLPNPTDSDTSAEDVSFSEMNKHSISRFHHCPLILPYFACCAMQSCYALLMVLYKVRASKASDRLSSCYHLLNNPMPGTEVQDSERLLEEIRHAVESLRTSFLQNAAFEGVDGMRSEIEGALHAAFFY